MRCRLAVCRFRLAWAGSLLGVWLYLGPVHAGAQEKPAQAVTEARRVPLPVGVAFDADLSYCKLSDCDLKLNVAYPKAGKGPFPAVVLIHGGGWFYGSHYDCVPFSLRLAEKGYVAVTVTYRFVPSYRFPDQVHDVKCAVRWLRANAAKYKVDRDRIGVFGHSAGAHLACMLGLAGGRGELEGAGGFKEERSDVCCVVSTSGLTDLAHLHARPAPGLAGVGAKMAVQGFLGAAPAQASNRYEQASPITYACKTSPPMLLICGTKDIIVPNEQSLRLEKKLRAAGAPVRLLTLVGAEHDFFGSYRERSEEATLEFFDRHLKNGKAHSPR